MIYVKSLLVGLLAVLGATFLLLVAAVAGIVAYNAIHPPSGEEQIGWDPISLTRQNPIVWLIVALIFCAGFFWEYKRLAR